MHDLAVAVELEETEVEIEELRRRGVYDDGRSVVRDGDHALLPVEGEPEGYDVVRQDDPIHRRRSLEDIVDVDDPPSGWNTVGDVALVRLEGYTHRERHEIAEGVMEVDDVDTVLHHRGVEGRTRVPDVEYVAGDRDTGTVHREHGVSYSVDPGEVMFSAGNQRERRRVMEIVDADEHVFDMFAGVGHWTLPAAVTGARATAVDVNPTAVDHLRRGLRLNDVEDRVEVHEGDCRYVSREVEPPSGGFDRVFMGYFGARDESYLDAAFEVVASGGTLHLHDAAPEPELWRAVGSAEEVAGDHGYCVDVDSRRVKSISEGVVHVVHDVVPES